LSLLSIIIIIYYYYSHATVNTQRQNIRKCWSVRRHRLSVVR